MIWRWLLLLLIALNIGVAGWLVFGHRQRVMPPLTDPGVSELELLPTEPDSDAAPSPTHVIEASGECLRIGPFKTRSAMHKAFNALMPRVPQIQFDQKEVSRSTGWWVYLPALATQEQALTVARRLAGKGVRDYYVVTAGDRRNMVSLGLFHSEDNAHRRLARITGLGFDAQLSRRHETLPEYWIDFALPVDSGFDWKDLVDQYAVEARPKACF